MTEFATFAGVLGMLGWIAGWVLGLRPQRLAPVADKEFVATDLTSPAMSLIIPARNEGHNLTKLLSSVEQSALRAHSLAETAGIAGPTYEVIVVDDSSSDDTAAVARSLGATVIAAGPLRMGWAGKPWACHVGSQAARGEVLIFLDADVEVAPSLLATLFDRVANTNRLESMQPHHVTKQFYEQFSLFSNVISAMATGLTGIIRPRRVSVAFGPILAIPAQWYRTFGGHQSVRAEVVEDLAIASAADRAGMQVGISLSDHDANFRMYPRGFASLITGWTKNLALGASAATTWRAALAALWMCALGSTIWTTATSVIAGHVGATTLIWYALVSAQVVWLARTVGDFGRLVALSWPLAWMGFVSLFVVSLLRVHVMGNVTWAGRTIDLRGPHTPEAVASIDNEHRTT